MLLRLPRSRVLVSCGFSSLLALSLASALAMPVTGCSPNNEDADVAGQDSTAGDLASARQVVALLGGEEGHCNDCHGVTASKVRAWGTAMKEIETSCMKASLSAVDRVNCLRATPGGPAQPFSPKRLGLYAAGVSTEVFKPLFDAAFPGDPAPYAGFKETTNMPRGAAPLSAAEFEKVKGWVLRGMPQLDRAFSGDADGGATTTTCNPTTTPELAAHLEAMKTEGWGARLADQATPMFGCGSATNPRECLTALPDVTSTYAAPDVPQTVRRLHEQPLASRYWIRSSADGRFIGWGLYTSSKIVDLAHPGKEISVEANYDPYFVPSNDGFAFAGSHTGDKIRLCRQSLLADLALAPDPSVKLTGPSCAIVGDDVYQSIGAALDGNRFFVTWGAHENDDGGNTITAPLPAAFSTRSKATFTPMVSNGLSYRAGTPVDVKLPREGDIMLSPSTLLVATRFGDGTKQLGYRIRFVKTTGTGSSLAIQTPLAAEVCIPGQKMGFSFDERFVVTHQYVDGSEPDQAGLPAKSSNVVIVDLKTGAQARITSSRAGVYALYPHFRADGWLYYLVRDMNTRTEYAVATDIALRMATH